MILLNKRCEKFNFLSHNSKFLGNQNLLDSNRNRCLLNCSSQNNYNYDIYKHCGDKKRLNVTDLLEFVSENRRKNAIFQ